MAGFRCSPEEYAYLQKVRNAIVSLKIDYRGLEETRDYALKAGRLEAVEVYNMLMKRRMEELRHLEREEAELEAVCFVGEKQRFCRGEV